MEENDVVELLKRLGFAKNENYLYNYERKIDNISYSLSFSDRICYMDNILCEEVMPLRMNLINHINHIKYLEEYFINYDDLYTDIEENNKIR